MKKMDATQSPIGANGLGGGTTDGEDTSDTVGSRHTAVLVERENKAQTRNQTSSAARSPLMSKDMGTRTRSNRNTGRA